MSEGPWHFAQALAAFDGARFPLDAASSKVLRQMLEPPEGCDAVLRPDGFEVRFGWHPARHSYHLATAPVAISALLGLARAVDGASDVHAVVGPAALAALDGLEWRFDRRRVWMSRAASVVSISIRRAEAAEARGATALPPEPIDSPPPSFVELASELYCPACTALGTRFRELMGGFLACSACGGSFRAPP
jgi:hypothetical protein